VDCSVVSQQKQQQPTYYAFDLAQVGADIVRLQKDAKGIKERLKHEHSEHKSVQTTKILSNFEARPAAPPEAADGAGCVCFAG